MSLTANSESDIRNLPKVKGGIAGISANFWESRKKMNVKRLMCNPYSQKLDLRFIHAGSILLGGMTLWIGNEAFLIPFFVLSLSGAVAFLLAVCLIGVFFKTGARKEMLIVSAIASGWFSLSAFSILCCIPFQDFAYCAYFAGGASAGYLLFLPFWLVDRFLGFEG